MALFLQGLLSGLFIGAFIGVLVIALLQASRTNYFRGNERRIRKGEKARDALDSVLRATRIKGCP